MNVEIKDLPITQPTSSFHEYTLEGGVTVRDKTNGVAKVVFSAKLAQKYHQPRFEVLINDKRMIFPTCSDPKSKGVVFNGSLKFKLKLKNEFIKVIEVDNSSKTVFYVDPRKDVEGIAYVAYSYIPSEISEEEAREKVQDIKTDFPHFVGDTTIYNRHGVAVFGWDTNKKRYALCWASPSDQKVQLVDCSECKRYADGGTSIAKSTNGKVNFHYLFGQEYYLNRETASLLS